MRCNLGVTALAAVVLMFLVEVSAIADDLIVPDDYATIQAAIDAAAEGDVVILQPGTYNETFNYNGKGIAVRSAEGPLVTRIDRNGSGGDIVNASGVPEGAVLEGIGFYRSNSRGLYMNGGTLVLTGCRFVGCSTGMYLDSGADVTLFDTQVVTCSRGIDLYGGSNLDMTASSCRNNTSRAIFMTQSSTLVATESEFADNSYGCDTGGSGAALRLDDSSEATLVKCSIARNRASCTSSNSNQYGGAITVRDNSGLVVRECDFELNENYAYRGYGVSISVINSNASLTVEDSTFTREKMEYGGTTDYGGSIFISGNGTDATITRCQFFECGGDDVTILGGAIYAESQSDVMVSDSRFERCGNEDNNQANGSAIYIAQSNDANSRFVIDDCQMVDERGQRNGAVYIAGSGDVQIRNSLFQNNTGGDYGGAVYGSNLWTGGPGFVFEDNDVIDCSGSNYGGGMYFGSDFDGFDITLERSRFINNFASNYGGALHFESVDTTGTNVQIRDCTFEGNRANSRGGAIYSVNTELIVLDCGFFGNDGDANNDDNPNDTNYPGDAFWISNNNRIPILVNNAFCGTRLAELVGPWIDKGGNIFEANCEFDCDGDGLPDDYEIEVGLAFDCNANGLPDSCEITSGADGDCNDDGRLDSCEVLADGAADCDGNLVPDSCQPDCDGDLLPDVCAIADGAADCDGDLVPDACQIADGSVPDANNDQVLDTCQVLDFAGLSTEIVLIQDRILDTQIPSTAVCYRLYADLLDPMASVTGVFGDLEHPLDLSSPAGFWQDLLGSDIPTSIACDPMPDYPDLRYDSWLTIGNDCQDDNLVQSIGIDYTAFNKGGSLIADDGIVFVAPGDPQSAPVDGRVLVAQLTTVDGSLPEGEVSLIGSNADGTEWFAYSVTWPEAPLVDCNQNGIHDAYDLSSGASRDCDGSGQPDECEFDSIIDCNGNGISDLCDVADGTSGDADGDLVPDECECFGDANRDGVVNVYDIIAVIIHWGEIGIQDADVNGDEIVDGGDLAAVLTGYGTCL